MSYKEELHSILYCEENVSYVNGLLERGEVPVYFSDAGDYYFAPSMRLPSGNVVDFFCFNKDAFKGYKTGVPSKVNSCDISHYVINPTMPQFEKLEAEKREREWEEWNKFLLEEEKRKEREKTSKSLAEASENLGKCMRALIYIDKVHKEYF